MLLPHKLNIIKLGGFFSSLPFLFIIQYPEWEEVNSTPAINGSLCSVKNCNLWNNLFLNCTYLIYLFSKLEKKKSRSVLLIMTTGAICVCRGVTGWQIDVVPAQYRCDLYRTAGGLFPSHWPCRLRVRRNRVERQR